MVSPEILTWDADTKEVHLQPGELNAHFAFFLTNVSSSEVLINSLVASCGCTAAKLPEQPWRLAPGQSGPIEADMNVAGKHGLVAKTLTVQTSAGFKHLTLKAVVPDPSAHPPPTMTGAERARNVQLALANRQAVFTEPACAECHSKPAVGKMGRELFINACAICHNAEHRASMVPDLQTGIKHPMPADFWNMTITSGKPNTLMPAFALENKGFLAPQQINSLVDYLVKEFPKEPKMVYEEVTKDAKVMRPTQQATPTITPTADIRPVPLLPPNASVFTVPAIK